MTDPIDIPDGNPASSGGSPELARESRWRV
jgi:hypothetical protein